MGDWTFFSNYGHVLVCLERDHSIRLRDVAREVGITERAVQKIVRDMQDAGYITVTKQGSSLGISADPGEESISNPSNSRDEVEQALNVADAEPVFRNLTYTAPLFIGDTIHFDGTEEGTVTFDIQNNYLHTGLTVSSSFNPFIQNTIGNKNLKLTVSKAI